jgi:hypothetical protein
LDFMGACCCSICYIAYRLSNPCPWKYKSFVIKKLEYIN